MHTPHPPLLCALFGLEDTTIEPWLVDAFLDRGNRLDEPQLHLLRLRGKTATPYAHAHTIRLPGTVVWNGFYERPSTIALIGRLMLHQGVPFTPPDNTLNAATARFLQSCLSPPDRDWGCKAAQGDGAGMDMWVAGAGMFLLPPHIHDLPCVRDVLNAPCPGTPLPYEALTRSWEALPASAQAQARLVPMLSFEMDASDSKHVHIHMLAQARRALANAYQFGCGLTTSHPTLEGLAEGAGPHLVPTPIPAGPATLPTHDF